MEVQGVEFIEAQELYNVLNRGFKYPSVSDPLYLLLIDCRQESEYIDNHILTAKKAVYNEEGKFDVPYSCDIECTGLIVVYDQGSKQLKDGRNSPYTCASRLWAMGSRNPVKVLKGGYEKFSALYPFLRSEKIMFTPRELDNIKTYPIEILPSLLYLGNWSHGTSAYIQKELKINRHIICSKRKGTFFKMPGKFFYNVSVNDDEDADIYRKFHGACTFICDHRIRRNVVLVFSDLGISRSATIAIAFVMQFKQLTLKDAYDHVKSCCPEIRPNRNFIDQLSDWEEELYDVKTTDISDPNY